MVDKAIVIISGGMDSTTLLYDIKNLDYDIYALSFDYNQRHKRELDMAKLTCEKLRINHKIIDLKQIGSELLQGSSLTSDAISTPHGNYADENMKLTVVPNRNMIMLSLALGYAFSIGAEEIFYGAHAGDHTIYPDCRPEFLDAMNRVADLADWKRAEIKAPYAHIDKGDIVKKGIELGVDYSLTYTCYEGETLACGKCGSCQERIEAFKKAGVPDPVKYRIEIDWR